MSEHAVTREQCKIITADIEAALRPVLERHGLSLELGTRHFGATFDVKVIGNPIGEGGKALDTRAQAFTQYATIYGLDPSDLGRTFTFQGKTHTVVGLNTRATKTPIITSSGGKQYRWAGVTVARMLKFEGADA